ncbi:uncharacterized protein N0V89_003326 [Didymosphaeria variabile]|uniref:Uncharacterized protein n=1 Tax=Didymosphaeria variabile TaxID=1932322 RepID=A0A9W8XWI4_9PLEO|nr:uncharacterized protein N0V89_003326 [Didymosphaeria variabile]KAJ4358742.1 hypothetical protein N0V89_003326 [Didymosphaeria variabile]
MAPSYDDERLRARRIRDAASVKLRSGMLKHLSQELVDMITENMVMELAAVHSQEIFSSMRSTNGFKYRLDLRQDIYVRYREIEGVTYVQWLSNTNMGGKGPCIYRARRDEKVKALWVAFDQLGVRRVDLKEHPVEISLGVGSLPFWKVIRPDTDEQTLVCIHDVRSSPSLSCPPWGHD